VCASLCFRRIATGTMQRILELEHIPVAICYWPVAEIYTVNIILYCNTISYVYLRTIRSRTCIFFQSHSNSRPFASSLSGGVSGINE
jgi:hypothetical protein